MRASKVRQVSLRFLNSSPLPVFLDSIAEYDLLSVALSDMENINNGAVSYVEGTDGFPAFSIQNTANLKSPYRLVVPDKLGEVVSGLGEAS